VNEVRLLFVNRPAVRNFRLPPRSRSGQFSGLLESWIL